MNNTKLHERWKRQSPLEKGTFQCSNGHLGISISPINIVENNQSQKIKVFLIFKFSMGIAVSNNLTLFKPKIGLGCRNDLVCKVYEHNEIENWNNYYIAQFIDTMHCWVSL